MSEFRLMCPFAPRIPFGGEDYDEQYGVEQRAAFPCVRGDCMAWRVDVGVPAAGAVGHCGLIGKK